MNHISFLLFFFFFLCSPNTEGKILMTSSSSGTKAKTESSSDLHFLFITWKTRKFLIDQRMQTPSGSPNLFFFLFKLKLSSLLYPTNFISSFSSYCCSGSKPFYKWQRLFFFFKELSTWTFIRDNKNGNGAFKLNQRERTWKICKKKLKVLFFRIVKSFLKLE